MAQNYDYTTAETIQDTLLNYVMGTRKLESQERMFDREMAEQQREFDINQTRLNKFFDKPWELERQKDLGDKQMLQQRISYDKQQGLLDEFEKKKKSYINAKKKNWNLVHKVAGGLGLSEHANADDYYGAEFEEQFGNLRPKPRYAGLPKGGFMPRYLPNTFFSQNQSPQHLLGMTQLGIMPGLGGQE